MSLLNLLSAKDSLFHVSWRRKMMPETFSALWKRTLNLFIDRKMSFMQFHHILQKSLDPENDFRLDNQSQLRLVRYDSHASLSQ